MTRWLIDRANTTITVRAKSDAAQQVVEVALRGMRGIRVGSAQGIKLTVDGNEEEWRLRDHATNVRRKLSNTGDLIYHLTDRIVFHIADSVSVKHCLHAASVCLGENALMIPANSGAGKSSFTTWLVANGFDYISDELILIDDEQKVDGLARPIQIKANGIEAIQHLLKSPDEIYLGKLANAIPVSSLGGAASELSEHNLKLIIFPQYKKGTEFSFNKLSSAEAGMRLMANHVNARNLEGHGFQAMMKTIRETQCYALEYGGFNKLPLDFAETLSALLSD
ncbi:MAG: hypothetical protein AAF431_07165 [Pseudomonadota bacterium]